MAIGSKFGQRVRALRAARGVGLRKFARQVGISPTYLSKIERGEFPPPAEDKVIAIADALEQDRDEMLALAGRVAAELAAVVLGHPRELAALLRAARELSPEEIRRLTRQAARLAKAPPEERARLDEEERIREGERQSLSGPRDGVAEGPPEMLL
jgi:transcriptional regulator with XRE-family HTH domain